jgi:hypothetical protein
MGPLPHVQANLSDNGLHRAGVQTRDRHQIHPGQLIQQAARIVRRGILAMREGFVLAVEWRQVVVPHGRDGLKLPFDFRFPGRD